MNKTVALQKCAKYDFEDVYNSIKNLMALVPPPDVKDKIVLLKPNILLAKNPDAAVCTHPVVVGAAVKAFAELGAKRVIVGESPAIANSTGSAKSTGILQIVEENGGEWLDFSDKARIECRNGKIKKSFDFATPFLQADVVVSLSKLKSHQLMCYTGAMKNLFGLMVGLDKAAVHYAYPQKPDFAAFLTDLNLAANARYAIMDAIVGMEGPGGPGNGDPVQLGFLAASDNILALDCVCASAVGYDPMEIANLKDALERRHWLNSLDEIQIAGCAFDDVKNLDFKAVHAENSAHTLGKMLPGALDSLAKLFFAKKPYFSREKCIRCGKCMEICPAKVLGFKEDKSKKSRHVVINRSKCIRCFCCHEICPVEAIVLKRF